MKRKWLAFATLAVATVSCTNQDMPYDSQYVVSCEQMGPHGWQACKAAPGPGVRVDCEPGGSGCQDVLNHYGFAYDEIKVYRQRLDTLYKYVGENRVPDFATKYNMSQMFPVAAMERPGIFDSLIKDTYRMHMVGDSSLVIVSAPLDSVGMSNIVFALDQDAQPPVEEMRRKKPQH